MLQQSQLNLGMPSFAPPTIQSPAFNLGNFQLPQSNHNFGIPAGINLATPSFEQIKATPTFNFNLSSGLSDPLSLSRELYQQPKPLLFSEPTTSYKRPNPANSAVDLTRATATSLLKPNIPVLGPINTVIKAAKDAHEIVNNVEQNINEGSSTAEAVTCQTIHTVTKSTTKTFLTGLIITETTTYVGLAAGNAAVGNPVPAVFLPVVAKLVPPAYAAAGDVSQTIGKGFEGLCHDAFAAARHLSNGGPKP